MDDQARPRAEAAPDLADLVASRLCHDLSNPLGAIGNGVELVEMTGSLGGPEMALIRDAVADAQARLRLLRLAFGAAAPGQETSAREVAAAVADYLRSGRLQARWEIAADLPRAEAKLGLLMLLCAETALPMGGTVTLRRGGGRWTLAAAGPRVALEPGLWSVLRFGAAGAGRALRPAEAQFLALYTLAEARGTPVNYRGDAEGLEMSLGG